MYVLVGFLTWCVILRLQPCLTCREPSAPLAGIHFWDAFTGLMLYPIALMIGGTLQGYSWMSNAPFMRSVTLMEPFYLWRAVGGMLMFVSHIVFAWNLWHMRPQSQPVQQDREVTRSEEHTSELQSRGH